MISFFFLPWKGFWSQLPTLNWPLGPSAIAPTSILQGQQVWVQSCLCFCLLYAPGNLSIFFSDGNHNALRAGQVLSESGHRSPQHCGVNKKGNKRWGIRSITRGL